MHYRLLAILLLPILVSTCAEAPEGGSSETNSSAQEAVEKASAVAESEAENPPAPGFNLAGSDAKAIRVVDSLVKYHGGRDTYDQARYFKWNFFGARTLHWDKLAKRARIDVPKDNTVYLLDYSRDTLQGRIRVKGDEVTDPDELARGLNSAYSMLINDNFWLLHQFKLLDDGVTLKALPDVRTDPMAIRPSYVIDQTFDGVGDTPQNRYRLYIDKVTYRINTWEFYRDAADEEPAIQTPWEGYRPYRGLLLSADRGGRFQLTDISVPAKLPESIFTRFN